MFSSSRFAHTTSLLRQLHWLRAPERIDLKLAVLVYSCLQGTAAPTYLVDELHRATDLEARRRLRSASLPSLIVRRTPHACRPARVFYSTSCHVRTVSDCPKSHEDLSLQPLFPVTSLYTTSLSCPRSDYSSFWTLSILCPKNRGSRDPGHVAFSKKKFKRSIRTGYSWILETCLSNLKSVFVTILEQLTFNAQKFRGLPRPLFESF